MGADSDLVSIHVNEVYKGKCGEYVSIRRLELQNLAPIDNKDCIIFLKSLGKIYSLPGTCNVYHIEDGRVFNNVELLNTEYESKFSVKGMLLNEFIAEYLTR